MSVKRLIPFFVIVLILGLVVFCIDSSIDAPVTKPGDNASADTAYLARRDIFTQYQSHGRKPIAEWVQLANDVNGSASLPENKKRLIESIASEAFSTWSRTFARWVGENFQSAPPSGELTQLKAFLASHNLLAEYLPKLAPHSKAMTCYATYFKPGAPQMIDAKLQLFMRGPFDPLKYETLLSEFERSSADITALRPIENAKARIQNQRNCHEKVKIHYNSLIQQSTVGVYGLRDLPLGTTVNKSFNCGGYYLPIEDFKYYYSLGKDNTIWRVPLW